MAIQVFDILIAADDVRISNLRGKICILNFGSWSVGGNLDRDAKVLIELAFTSWFQTNRNQFEEPVCHLGLMILTDKRSVVNHPLIFGQFEALRDYRCHWQRP